MVVSVSDEGPSMGFVPPGWVLSAFFRGLSFQVRGVCQSKDRSTVKLRVG